MSLDQTGLGRSIVVEQHQDVAGCSPDTEVDAAREAGVVIGANHLCPGIPAPGLLAAPIRGAVIDQHDLDAPSFGPACQ